MANLSCVVQFGVRCDSCRWWKSFHEAEQPAGLLAQIRRLAPSVATVVEALPLHRLGECTLFECRGKGQVHDDSMLIVTRTGSGNATIVTQDDFGCVQWKALEAIDEVGEGGDGV